MKNKFFSRMIFVIIFLCVSFNAFGEVYYICSGPCSVFRDTVCSEPVEYRCFESKEFRVDTLPDTEKWLRIREDNHNCKYSGYYVRKFGSQCAHIESKETIQYKYIVKSANVYEATSLSSRVIGRLGYYESFYSDDNLYTDSVWKKIQYNGRTGYVYQYDIYDHFRIDSSYGAVFFIYFLPNLSYIYYRILGPEPSGVLGFFNLLLGYSVPLALILYIIATFLPPKRVKNRWKFKFYVTTIASIILLLTILCDRQVKFVLYGVILSPFLLYFLIRSIRGVIGGMDESLGLRDVPWHYGMGITGLGGIGIVISFLFPDAKYVDDVLLWTLILNLAFSVFIAKSCKSYKVAIISIVAWLVNAFVLMNVVMCLGQGILIITAFLFSLLLVSWIIGFVFPALAPLELISIGGNIFRDQFGRLWEKIR